MSFQGLICKRIELPAKYVRFDLCVPYVRVKFVEPLAKGSKLFGGEATDIILDLFDLTHSDLLLTNNKIKFSNNRCGMTCF